VTTVEPSPARPWFVAKTTLSPRWCLVLVGVWFVVGTLGTIFGLWEHFIAQIAAGAVAEANAALWGAAWGWEMIEAASRDADQTTSRVPSWFVPTKPLSTKWCALVAVATLVCGAPALAFGLWEHAIGEIIVGAALVLNSGLWGVTWVWAKIEVVTVLHE
jgi:hypothetical protein